MGSGGLSTSIEARFSEASLARFAVVPVPGRKLAWSAGPLKFASAYTSTAPWNWIPPGRSTASAGKAPSVQERSVAGAMRMGDGARSRNRASPAHGVSGEVPQRDRAFRTAELASPCSLHDGTRARALIALAELLARDMPCDRSMRSGRSSPSLFSTRRRPEALPWATRLLLVTAAVFLVGVWGWLRNADSRALASMDPDLRRELFDRSRAEAETLCSRPELADECRARVEFLARFPECDASCQKLVASQLRHPTR
jgi:cytochrome b pre-mRNA-processing protein 3